MLTRRSVASEVPSWVTLCRGRLAGHFCRTAPFHVSGTVPFVLLQRVLAAACQPLCLFRNGMASAKSSQQRQHAACRVHTPTRLLLCQWDKMCLLFGLVVRYWVWPTECWHQIGVPWAIGKCFLPFFDSTWVLDVKICNNRTGPQISSYEQKKAAYISLRRKPEQRQLVVYRATSNILTPTSSYWKSLLLFRDCTFSMEMTGGSNILKVVHHEFPFP